MYRVSGGVVKAAGAPDVCAVLRWTMAGSVFRGVTSARPSSLFRHHSCRTPSLFTAVCPCMRIKASVKRLSLHHPLLHTHASQIYN